MASAGRRELKREDLNDSKFTFDNPSGLLQILPVAPPKGHSLPTAATLYTYLFVIHLCPGWRFNLSLTIDLLSLRVQRGNLPIIILL